jgi:minor histocompatibility antigen H13
VTDIVPFSLSLYLLYLRISTTPLLNIAFLFFPSAVQHQTAFAQYTIIVLGLTVMEGNSTLFQAFGEWGYYLWQERDLAQMYTHLLLAALFPIYAGAHASLRRPPSAAKPRKKALKEKEEDEDEDEDELDMPQKVEGLQPSDAILFPVLAGFTLAGLYYLIQWLKDPTLLNKILGHYFSLLGVFGVGRLATDALNVGTSIVFPNLWARNGKIYYIDPILSAQVTDQPLENPKTHLHRKFEEEKTNPFPGLLSRINFSNTTTKRLWALRTLFHQRWIFRGYIHPLPMMKSRIRLNDAFGFLIGVATIAAYNILGRPWYLTNIMGFGFCYGTLQLMSPTTFWTGTLVLAGLFVYDVVMVFYTPLMVTVATSLDVPIKLVLPGPKRGGMLGLGDIVLPGIMIGLALRFDLYLHYLRKASSLPKNKLPPYKTPTSSQIGDLFWTSSAPALRSVSLADAAFRKTYFHASLLGYVVGMVATLVVLNVWNHAQPALLYLVPGVLIALWGTAGVRGELGVMWRFTESGEGIADVNVEEIEGEHDKPNKDEKTPAEEGQKPSIEGGKAPAEEKQVSGEKEKGMEREKAKGHEQFVFLFSLSAPKKRNGLQSPKKSKLFD